MSEDEEMSNQGPSRIHGIAVGDYVAVHLLPGELLAICSICQARLAHGAEIQHASLMSDLLAHLDARHGISPHPEEQQ